MEGRIFTYVHHDGHLLAWVEVLCQTDFAARTNEFLEFGNGLAMQLASDPPESHLHNAQALKPLLESEWVVDPTGESTDERRKAVADKLGENIQIGRFDVIYFGDWDK